MPARVTIASTRGIPLTQSELSGLTLKLRLADTVVRCMDATPLPRRPSLLAIFFLLATLTPVPAQSVAADDPFDGDFRIWNEFMLREWSRGDWYTYTWAEVRWVDHADRLGTWLLQQKLTGTLRPGLKTNVGAAWIQVLRRSGATDELFRLEVELNPRFSIGKRSELQFRNRLETRWWDYETPGTQDGGMALWARNRVRFVHRGKWFPRMNRIEFSNETFYDFDEGRFAENRLRLFDTFLQLTPSTTLDLFLQVRSLNRGAGGWSHAGVLGIGLRYYAR